MKALRFHEDGLQGSGGVMFYWPIRASIYACVIGMLYLGIFPNSLVNAATQAIRGLH